MDATPQGLPGEEPGRALAALHAALARQLEAWRASRRPAVAVSGGADSMALAVLAKDWGDPLALVVNHGLRQEAAAEAQLTATRLAARGIACQVLTIHGLGAGPGVARRARIARYAALTEATCRAGRVDLWLGHHRRDQAETVLMRRLSNSGAAGLAGMAAISEARDIRLLRPLLDTGPGVLRFLLQQNRVGWIEDPSNSDEAALRTRLRQDLNDPDGNGPVTAALAAHACDSAQRRAGMEVAIAAELAGRCAIFPEGYAVLSAGPLAPATLGTLIRGLTGSPYTPSGLPLARLAADPKPAVLAGIRLMAAGRLGPGLLLVREPAAIAPAISAAEGTLWDRRFLIQRHRPLDDLDGEPGSVGAVGPDAPALRRYTGLPAAILQTLPALRANGALVEVPHIGYRAHCGSARVAVSFAPATPASGAPFGTSNPGDAEPGVRPHLRG